GWVVLPEASVRDFETLAQHLFLSAPSAAQHAALAAFSPGSIAILEERRAEFARRRDLFLLELKKSLAVPAEPRGAFYVYADCGGDAKRFCLELLSQEAVAATPGIDFGANGTDRCVRFAYTRPRPELEDAAARIRRFAPSWQRPSPRTARSARPAHPRTSAAPPRCRPGAAGTRAGCACRPGCSLPARAAPARRRGPPACRGGTWASPASGPWRRRCFRRPGCSATRPPSPPGRAAGRRCIASRRGRRR